MNANAVYAKNLFEIVLKHPQSTKYITKTGVLYRCCSPMPHYTVNQIDV